MLKSLRVLFSAAVFCLPLTLMADNPAPYSLIYELPVTPIVVDNGDVLSGLINTYSASIIVDVQSNEGGMSRFIAQQNLPSVKQIYAINLWRSSKKTQYQRFLSNVIQENTAGIITPLRMSSQEGAKGLNIQADFIYLGNDGEEVVYADILAWFAHLSTNGIICGNNWYNDGVPIAVTRAASDLDLIVRLVENVWYLARN